MKHLALAILLLALGAITPASAQESTPDVQLASLRVTTDPSGATIYLDGKEAGDSPLTLPAIKPGRYVVTARLKGHIEERTVVMLGPGSQETADLSLRRITGIALIESTPSGAEITINGAHGGRTPALLKDLPMGKSRITLSKTGYKDQTLEHMVESARPALITTTLKSDMATLRVSTVPAGARVELGGISHGTTPTTIEGIEAGTHTLTISLAGHKPHSSTVTLQAGADPKVVQLRLEELGSSLQVVTIPSGARIYVNNRFEGLSPLDLTDLQSGDYRIRAEKKGTDPLARTVTLEPGQSITEEFRLSDNTGILQVITEPVECDVFVDGQKIGTTKALHGGGDVSEPLEIDTILEGEHIIQVSRSGYVARKMTVKITKGEATPLHVKLKRRFIPTHKILRKEGDSVTGILLDPGKGGIVRIETAPGIIREIEPANIRRIQSIDP